MIIRKAIHDDLPEMKKLFHYTIVNSCKTDYNEKQIFAWISSIKNEKRWSYLIDNQFVLIADLKQNKSSKIIGFASIKNNNHIDFMYVHKDFQRKGIANLLYSELEKEAIKNNEKIIYADVSKTAKLFFEKNNFKIIKPQIVIRDDIGIENYKMKKFLK